MTPNDLPQPTARDLGAACDALRFALEHRTDLDDLARMFCNRAAIRLNNAWRAAVANEKASKHGQI